MKRPLTLLAVMVMGAVGVRTQQPANEWQAMTHEAKVTFATGVNAGIVASDVSRGSARVAHNSDIVLGLDKFYQVLSNSSVSIEEAVLYVEMKLASDEPRRPQYRERR